MDNLSLSNTYGPYAHEDSSKSVVYVCIRGAEQGHTAAEGTWLQKSCNTPWSLLPALCPTATSIIARTCG